MDYLKCIKDIGYDLYTILDSRAEICQIFRCFFGKFKKSKRYSEINWPLGILFFTCIQQ